MGFRIITDSASDMPQETAAKLGVTVMPIHTRFGDEEYLDGVTLKPREFFEKLVKTDEIPRTSQITPYEFGQEFEKWISAGDGVLCITMSAGVSGTYQSACAAAAEYGDRVIVIDSRQFCISLYVLVEYACRLRDEGKTLEDMAGSILSIKPVITIIDGVVEVIGKARGSKKANNMLVEFIDRVGGVDFDMPYCLGYTGFSEDVLTKYINDHAARYKEALKGITVVPVGATVGTYAGPGAVALAFFNK